MHSAVKVIVLLTTTVVLCFGEEITHNILPVEPPNYFLEDPSPLTRDNLQRPDYFDFLNTLYRHDRTKSSLFEGNPINPVFNPPNYRVRRAVVFRPLFVYRQQQVQRQKVKRV